MVKTAAERLADLEQSTKEVDDVVLGRWDFTTGKRQVGLAERLDTLTVQVNTIIKILKYGIGPLVGICAISSLSTSFKDIVPAVVKVALSLISLH